MADYKLILLANANSNVLRVMLFETSAPNAAVATQDVNPPFTNSQQLNFTNLNKTAHYVRIYEVVGGNLGQLLGNYTIYPTETNMNQEPNLELTVGLDIPANQNTFNGSAFPQHNGKVAGVDYYITRRGVGELKVDEFTNVAPFGFQLTNGQTMNDEETFIIHFYARISVVPANSVSNTTIWKDLVEVTGNKNITAIDNNKILNVNSTVAAAPTLTLDFPINIMELSNFRIFNLQGSQRNVIINAPSGVQIVYTANNTTAIVNDMVLGKGQELEITKKGSFYYAVERGQPMGVMGSIVHAYFEGLNMELADGRELSRTIYAKAWKAIRENLSIGNGLVTEANWLNNQECFSTGDGVDTFRIPDLRGYFIRNLDTGRGIDVDGTNRAVGVKQMDEVKEHDHDTNTRRDNNVVSSGNGNGARIKGGTEQPTDKTSKVGGSETRPKNVGLKCYLWL